MRIALCLSRLPVSGIGTSVGIIHDGLKEAGHQVEVLITGSEQPEDSAFAQESGWHVVNVAPRQRYLRKRLEATLDALVRGGYEVLLNNTSMETQLLLPCLPEGLRRVCVLRGLNASAVSHVALNSAHAHAVVGLSQEMVRVLMQDARVRAPVRLIPNCTRVTGGTLPQLHGRLEICYVGRLSVPDKNVLMLPDIAQQLRQRGAEFRLRIVGEGPAANQLRRRIQQLAAHEVECCGLVVREAAREIMQSSHFCLLPSVSEGLSNVMLECMALGCVPVCSDIENFKWVLGEAAVRLQCRLMSPADYAARLLDLRDKPQDYQMLQAYLRARQQAEFTPERTTGGYLELLKELASPDGRRLPKPCELQDLDLPLAYRVWCSPLWRSLQVVQDAFLRLSPRCVN